MKMVLQDDQIIVFLKHFEIDFETEELEDIFKDIFAQLENKYHLEMNGYYEINVYPDRYYGMILQIETVDIDYYHYFQQVDMKINVLKDSEFLYKMEYGTINQAILLKGTCYRDGDDLYFRLTDSLTDYEFALLLEQTSILYGTETKKIIKYGKKVNL